ncbi:HAD family hydrolase [Kurthia sibirica]|uniref:Sucrose phosphatase-like domain-containing protein n=1 Tax=Kurthia sibirica TaxID=202750 RepID=A0A2U3AJP4_9BACL|nr:HAD family hydrolase [Kurthia sibirica]PWI24760.1 hypothetical protein DEX24_11575 [Kurthia sibirica]GEK35128.1 hypothetical protein KSI01_26610 [Kurthia sibirica]
MILFTSDLDRTLIYSRRMMAMYPIVDDSFIVETNLSQQPRSYMSVATYTLLQQIHRDFHFIPVTTRSVAEYKRIQGMVQLQAENVVTSNGGTILRHGQIDEKWQHTIRDLIAQTAVSKDIVLQHFDFSNWQTTSFVLVDELFYVCKVDIEKIEHDVLYDVIRQFADLGWRVILHHTKLYILPLVLTKERAVQYLKNEKNYTVHIAAGDSMMDVQMNIEADFSFVPAHGTIDQADFLQHDHIHFSEKTGLAFTEEVLRFVMSKSE